MLLAAAQVRDYQADFNIQKQNIPDSKKKRLQFLSWSSS